MILRYYAHPQSWNLIQMKRFCLKKILLVFTTLVETSTGYLWYRRSKLSPTRKFRLLLFGSASLNIVLMGSTRYVGCRALRIFFVRYKQLSNCSNLKCLQQWFLNRGRALFRGRHKIFKWARALTLSITWTVLDRESVVSNLDQGSWNKVQLLKVRVVEKTLRTTGRQQWR